MNKENLKISVVTVCYNAADTIEETMLSVLNQTYENVEYIIIDGGSTDGTVDIIKKYAQGGSEFGKYHHDIAYWISEPDKGIYDAMNKGIAAATGDYINFMNSGDRFYNNNIVEGCFSQVRTKPTIIFGNWIESFSGQLIEKKALPLRHLKKGMSFPHQSAFINVKYHKGHLYNISYKISADYELFYSAEKNNLVFQYINIPIAVYDMSPEQSISLKNHKTLIEEHLKIQGVKNPWVNFLKTYKNTSFLIRRYIKNLIPSSYVSFIKLNIDRIRKHP